MREKMRSLRLSQKRGGGSLNFLKKETLRLKKVLLRLTEGYFGVRVKL